MTTLHRQQIAAIKNPGDSVGFTLLEIMVTTAIIGVLASLALPVYLDYSIQARVSEGVLSLSELRRRVEIAFNEDKMP